MVLAEGGTYRFQIDLDGDADAVVVEPGDELFSFDDGSRLHGRLLPRQHVGRIRVCVTDASSGRPGWVELDVRPVKLSAEVEYRQMLEDITDVATEALLQGFAPASLALTTTQRLARICCISSSLSCTPGFQARRYAVHSLV